MNWLCGLWAQGVGAVHAGAVDGFVDRVLAGPRVLELCGRFGDKAFVPSVRCCSGCLGECVGALETGCQCSACVGY